MIKLVLFDLDGVLINAKQIHFEALNEALGEYAITEKEHLSIYDGHKTRQKLQLLTDLKGLPNQMHDVVFKKKLDSFACFVSLLESLLYACRIALSPSLLQSPHQSIHETFYFYFYPCYFTL